MTPPTSEPTPNLPEPSGATPLVRDGGASEPTGRFREGLVERSGEGRPHVVRRLVAKGKRGARPR